MDMRHGEHYVETGVITAPDGAPRIQIKNTALADDSPLPRGYELCDLAIGRTGLFTCSDLTTYPEDPIALAKAGMQIVLVPGCGFAGPLWKDFLCVRAADLSCVMVYADGGRAAIVDRKGLVIAESHTPETILMADVDVQARQPSARLRSSI